MNDLLKTLLAGFAVMAASSSVFAADVTDEAVPEVVVSSQPAGGWYLRGDLGYAVSGRTGLDATVAGDNFSRRFDLENGFAPSAGVGYEFTDYLRADVTAGYARQDLDDFPAKVRSWDVMANAYVDMANFAGFTPYLGAGLGFANVRYTVDTDQGSFKSDDDYRFAWALMAGVAVDLTENVKLDLGYRYGVISGGDLASAGGVTLSDKDLKSHQVRAGIRVAAW